MDATAIAVVGAGVIVHCLAFDGAAGAHVANFVIVVSRTHMENGHVH